MRRPDSDTEKPAADADNGPRSPLRTVQVLHALAGTPGGMPLGSLSTLLELPKTSVFRLLRALEAGGYVVSEGGVHQLGPEALKLGNAIVQNREFPDCAQPAMAWLFEHCAETIILGTIADNGHDVIYSLVIEATNPLRFSVKPGTQKPLYCSASGQAILAYMPEPQIKEYLKTVKFQPLAPRTIASVAELKRRMAQIRAEGIAISEDGMFEGVYSVAAPVVDSSGAVRAGVSISAPSSRALRHEVAFARLVRQAGEEISRVLGYSGGYPPGQ
ncbi:IclR family transcriptional regulator [Bordetella genomosp. 13]|uniref:IclR family transcriptional regulator n=1 Tax=Bordetella genomosp. 13 TaxID=463040 RepID=UPI0011A06793|nr:IclR family transcriptional regulator [Bordetella genomosp. 13]